MRISVQQSVEVGKGPVAILEFIGVINVVDGIIQRGPRRRTHRTKSKVVAEMRLLDENPHDADRGRGGDCCRGRCRGGVDLGEQRHDGVKG